MHSAAVQELLDRLFAQASGANSITQPHPIEVCGICGEHPKSSGGTLLRCSRCKQVRYCDKACQAKDWPFHKHACKALALPRHQRPLSADAGIILGPEVRGIPTSYPAMGITVAMRDQEYGFCLGGSVLADLNASSYQFQPLPVTAALGLALAEAGSPTTSLPGVPNAAFEYFSIDPGPKSPMFGRAMIAPGPPWGLLLVRQDGRHLHELHLMALLDYLQYDLREVINVKHKERAGEVVDKEEIARRLLTPSAFSAAFEKTRTKEIAQGAKGWKELENPVQLGS
ncbi:hypothetical protein LTS10_006695 [Elasticomyces elasticus]|nr:hypothetical protein LTS10_006695 [Elasticomyces elasticus]